MIALVCLVGCVEMPADELDIGALRDPTATAACVAAADGDFYGEVCVEAPDVRGEPVNTLCHPDEAGVYRGWCVAGTCRPQCGADYCCANGSPLWHKGSCYCATP